MESFTDLPFFSYVTRKKNSTGNSTDINSFEQIFTSWNARYKYEIYSAWNFNSFTQHFCHYFIVTSCHKVEFYPQKISCHFCCAAWDISGLVSERTNASPKHLWHLKQRVNAKLFGRSRIAQTDTNGAYQVGAIYITLYMGVLIHVQAKLGKMQNMVSLKSSRLNSI